MRQRQIYKTQQVSVQHVSTTCAKKDDLGNVKLEVDKLGFDELKNVPSGLNSLKSKVNKLYIGKLETVSIHF